MTSHRCYNWVGEVSNNKSTQTTQETRRTLQIEPFSGAVSRLEHDVRGPGAMFAGAASAERFSLGPACILPCGAIVPVLPVAYRSEQKALTSPGAGVVVRLRL